MSGLRRGGRILEILSASEAGETFSELCRRCGDLAPGTMSRLLRTLTEEAWVEHDDGGAYRLGDRAFALARQTLGVVSRSALVQPELESLAGITGESAAFFNLEADGFRLLSKVEMEGSYHYQPRGKHWSPIPDDPFGWACLAFLPGDDAAAGLDRTQEFARLRTARCLVTRRCMSVDVMRVVAPVFLADGGAVMGAVGITAICRAGLDAEIPRFEARVRDTAARLSAVMVAEHQSVEQTSTANTKDTH